MKFVRLYLAIFALSVLASLLLWKLFPSHSFRHLLKGEDGIIENLSAFFFLSSFVLGVNFLRKRRNHKRIHVLICVLGLIGFLDELSFGERLIGLTMPVIGGIKIDAVHDVFELAFVTISYLLSSNTTPAYIFVIAGLALGTIVGIFSQKYWPRIVDLLAGRDQQPHHWLLSIFAVLILSALIIDLGLVNYRPLFLLEELFEMNAGLALCFFWLSLDNAVRRSGPVFVDTSLDGTTERQGLVS